MSSLAWIDFDAAERQRVQRIMSLFSEHESRDELGFGSVRDAIADHLFPGTSTIQTRLRYMLFIPWLYHMLEQRGGSVEELRAEARDMEARRLVEALKAGGEVSDIIGSAAGLQLQRLPSSVYWAGLGAWGIRAFSGSIDDLLATLHARRRAYRPRSLADAAPDPLASDFWHPALPPAPDKLLEKTSFELTVTEAQFLIDRLIASQPNALLTFLARRGDDADCDYVWLHPHLSSFPRETRERVEHARLFSDLMSGASLLYNLTLSESREKAEWIDDYRERLAAWTSELDRVGIQHWALDAFWEVARHPAHTFHPATRRFVIEWRDIVLKTAGAVSDSAAARRVIEQRERRLKGSQSRYANRTLRDRWSGASGVARLGFRWPQAQAHLRDLAHAR